MHGACLASTLRFLACLTLAMVDFGWVDSLEKPRPSRTTDPFVDCHHPQFYEWCFIEGMSAIYTHSPVRTSQHHTCSRRPRQYHFWAQRQSSPCRLHHDPASSQLSRPQPYQYLQFSTVYLTHPSRHRPPLSPSSLRPSYLPTAGTREPDIFLARLRIVVEWCMPVTALPIIERRWVLYQTMDSPEAGEINDVDPSELTGISSPTEMQGQDSNGPVTPQFHLPMRVSRHRRGVMWGGPISRQIFIPTIVIWAIAPISISRS
jgi:hypothetical protein